MATDQEATMGHSGEIPDEIIRIRERRDRRIAEIRARKSEIKVEPFSGLKRLVDSQDEYRERIDKIIRRIVDG
jgi:hypothetical protein